MEERLRDDLDRAIQRAAIDGALTKEAVEQFNGLIKENERLVENNASLDRANKLLEKEYELALNGRSAAERELADFREREGELLKREAKATELRLCAEYEAKRVEDHKNMMTVVFRPQSMREEVYRSRPAVDENGYQSGIQINENETTERSET